MSKANIYKKKSLSVFLGRVMSAMQKARHFFMLRFFYRRAFNRSTKRRLLLLTIDERIPQSQIYPFHYYAKSIGEKYDTEVREVPVSEYLKRDFTGLNDATIVCFQTNFDVTAEALANLVNVVELRSPKAQLVYLDWFAPTDLRLAEMLNPHVSIYLKKHVLADYSKYSEPTMGDTNLTDYYARYFDISMPKRKFDIPDDFLDKLVIGPSFLTAGYMLKIFLSGKPQGGSHRPIDVHARLGVAGIDWYQAMRSECMDALKKLPDLNVVSNNGIGVVEYLFELRSSKICFSPFGYGEVCWRDYEAISHGAVLLKTDMSHIVTEPNIFVPYETYIPLKWDLSDFEEKVRMLLDDEELRNRVARNAFAVLSDYIKQEGFVGQMADVLSLEVGS